jgi:hypothetical protein
MSGLSDGAIYHTFAIFGDFENVFAIFVYAL